MEALDFASNAHKGQYRWDGITKYIEHPKAVVALLKSWKMYNQTVINAGYLHDVLGDTNVTRSDIIQEFGLECADLVSELTRPENADYIEHCAKMSKLASLIKQADILCNLTDTDSKKSPAFVQKRMNALAVLAPNTVRLSD